MKQLLLGILLLLALGAQAQQGTPPQLATTVSAAAPPHKQLMALDAANGVGETHFGADRTTFSRLLQTDADGSIVYYKRRNDHLVFGRVMLHEVLHGFYHDKLALIRLQKSDEASSQVALNELVARYGYDYRATKLPERHSLLERLLGGQQYFLSVHVGYNQQGGYYSLL